MSMPPPEPMLMMPPPASPPERDRERLMPMADDAVGDCYIAGGILNHHRARAPRPTPEGDGVCRAISIPSIVM